MHIRKSLIVQSRLAGRLGRRRNCDLIFNQQDDNVEELAGPDCPLRNWYDWVIRV